MQSLGAPDRAGQRVFSLHLQIAKIGRCSVPLFSASSRVSLLGCTTGAVQPVLSMWSLQWFAPSLAS